MKSMNSIIRRAIRDEKLYNVGAFVTHLELLDGIFNTHNNIYFFHDDNINQPWNLDKQPWNCEFLKPHPFIPNNFIYQIPPYVHIDCIISKNRITPEFNTVRNICNFLQIPHINIEQQILPAQNINIKKINDFVADVNVFTNEDCQSSWLLFDDKNSIVGLDWDIIFRKMREYK